MFFFNGFYFLNDSLVLENLFFLSRAFIFSMPNNLFHSTLTDCKSQMNLISSDLHLCKNKCLGSCSFILTYILKLVYILEIFLNFDFVLLLPVYAKIDITAAKCIPQ